METKASTKKKEDINEEEPAKPVDSAYKDKLKAIKEKMSDYPALTKEAFDDYVDRLAQIFDDALSDKESRTTWIYCKFKLIDNNKKHTTVEFVSKLKEQIKILEDIDRPDKEERSHCIDFLMLVYLKLFIANYGVPCDMDTCKKLFFAFSTVPMEEFLFEHDKVFRLVEAEVVNIYIWIIMAPFRTIDYGNGNPQLVWYEKFCFIYLFSYLKFLNITDKQYRIIDVKYPIPSLEMAKTLKKDEEFGEELIELLEFEKTLFLDIAKMRDFSIFPV